MDQYRGEVGNVPSLPTAVAISSSTNTTPISVVTTTPHGCETGDTVMIDGHLVNTNANGASAIVKVNTTTLQLVGTVGNGVGAATGTLHNQNFGSSFAVAADGDPPVASTVAPADEANADRSTLLLRVIGWQQRIFAGGETSVEARGSLRVKALGVMAVDNLGKIQLDLGSILHVDLGAEQHVDGLVQIRAGAGLSVLDGGVVTLEDNSLTSLFGEMRVRAGEGIKVYELGAYIEVLEDAHIFIRDGGFLRVDDGGEANIFGQLTITSTGEIVYNSGAVASGFIADDTTSARSGPTLLSGDDAYVAKRFHQILVNGLTGSVDIDAWKYDVIYIPSGTPSGTRTWRFTTPPGSAETEVTVRMYAGYSFTGGDELVIKDDGTNAVIQSFGEAPNEAHWSRLIFNGTAWMRIAQGKDDVS